MKRRRLVPLIAIGVSVGLMHAAKETCVIALMAIGMALALTMAGCVRFPRMLGARQGRADRWKRVLTPFCLTVAVAALVSALFHSSFFSNPKGVADSLATYGHYLARAAGEGSAGPHDYPWHQYFAWLFWWQSGEGPLWTEASIGILAAVGLVASILGKGIPANRLRPARFLSVYTVVITLAYSVISYKTPWCALGFLHGMILLAGVGTAALFRVLRGRPLNAVAALVLAAAAVHLGWQAHRASFVAFEDVNNPYVYAHTTSDVPRLVEELRRFASGDDGRPSMHVQVICPDADYWPLPWYMRDFDKVGWFAEKPKGIPGELIVVQPTAEIISDLQTYLYVDQPPGKRLLYAPAFERKEPWLLRPAVTLEVYGKRRLLEAHSERGGRAE